MWERASYFITAVAAVLGWLITYYVERVTKTPTIEYVITEKAEGPWLRAEYRLTNVNRATAFGPIAVSFLAAPSSPIAKKMLVRPREPASDGRAKATTRRGSAKFVLQRLTPGASIKFILRVRGKERPHLYLETGETVRFTGRSLDTWLARNETEVVLGLIVAWAAILLALVGRSLAIRDEKDPPEAREAKEEP